MSFAIKIRVKCKYGLSVLGIPNSGYPRAINNKVQQHQNNKRRALATRTNHQRYIQSGSVFSEGAGELRKPKIHSDRYLSNGERDQTAVFMPKVIKWEVRFVYNYIYICFLNSLVSNLR